MKPHPRVPRLLIMFVLALAIAAPVAVAKPSAAYAATSIELYFSEYIEGSSNNKALEIYNGTGTTVDMSAYTVQMYFNGSMNAGLTLYLTGTVADGDVYVVAHSSADAAILAQADFTNGSGWYNGDDAVVLVHNGVIVDSIGQIGFDPGSEWGSGLTSTADNTLRRKSTVCSGDPNATDAFDPSVEWDGYATNTFDGLGSYTTECVPFTGAVLSITAANAVQPEGDSGTTPFTFTVTRYVDISGSNTADYTVSSTEADATDFGGAFPSGAVNFAAGDTSQTITVDVSGDTDVEPDESFAVTLSNPSNGAIFLPDAASGIIQNDDVTTVRIHDIQGDTDAHLLDGLTVAIEAIVIGDFQNNDADGTRNLGGFYVQEEDADADTNPLTSEGLFIYDGSGAVDVNIGDLVRITGTVADYHGETELTDLRKVVVLSSGNNLPTAAEIALPTMATTTSDNGYQQPDLEAFEGMRVTFPETLYVTEMYQLDRFNEIKLSEGGRLGQFTQTNLPSVSGYADHLREIGARTITYDDGQNEQNEPIGNLDGFGPVFSTATDIRMGDTIDNLSGVLSYQWAGNSASGSTWRVRAAVNGENTFQKVNERPATPEPVGGTLKVASFNVLNFFTTLTDSDYTSGPVGLDPRGAKDQAEYDRQLQKLVTALTALDADVVGLLEIENEFEGDWNGDGMFAIDELVKALNAATAPGTYDYVDPGRHYADSSDAIAVAMIYKPGSVQIAPDSTVAILDDEAMGALNLGFTNPVFDGDGTNRASLAATFEELASEGKFTVVVNHLKSKGSAGPGDGNEDILDGAGASNAIRVQAATALNAWLATDPTNSQDEDFLLVGDFNSYAMEDPIVFLEGQGYMNLAQHAFDLNAAAYVFDGQVGTLDYALASGHLLGQVTGFTDWLINADEADALDYNLDFERDPAIFDGTVPYRASDHDPLVVGMNPLPPVFATCGEYNIYRYPDGSLSAPDFDGNLIAGTDANDRLFGTQDADLILGFDGSDRIQGMGGDDVICGGPGQDILFGIKGNNKLYGGEGEDWLKGGPDNDQLFGGDGNDDLSGGVGDDVLYGEGGVDVLAGGMGDDLLFGGGDGDYLYGDNGSDTLDGGDGDDLCLGGPGSDTINACEGASAADSAADEAETIDEAEIMRLNDGPNGEFAVPTDFNDVFVPFMIK